MCGIAEMTSFVETSCPSLPPFDSSIHLLSLPPTPQEQQAIDELRQLLILNHSNEENNENKNIISLATQEWCQNEHILKLFLIARTWDVNAAYEMIQFALNWRDVRQPHAIELQDDWHVKMSGEGETGKIRRPGSLFSSSIDLPFSPLTFSLGHDQWGRPIVVLDNSVENTKSLEDQMLFLAWNLESAMLEMPNTVDKFCLFLVS
jgi:hypothetical protein